MKRQGENDSGFSLVEMMVVLVIVGLMTSVVVLSLPSPASEQTSKLTELRNAFTAIARESVISGDVIGVRFSNTGYTVLTFEEGEWGIAPNGFTGVWDSRNLTSISVEGIETDLEQKEDAQIIPHIWFLPTGERTDFQISFKYDGVSAAIVSVPTGIEVQHDG